MQVFFGYDKNECCTIAFSNNRFVFSDHLHFLDQVKGNVYDAHAYC
jgi:hypothetical protein